MRHRPTSYTRCWSLYCASRCAPCQYSNNCAAARHALSKLQLPVRQHPGVRRHIRVSLVPRPLFRFYVGSGYETTPSMHIKINDCYARYTLIVQSDGATLLFVVSRNSLNVTRPYHEVGGVWRRARLRVREQRRFSVRIMIFIDNGRPRWPICLCMKHSS